MEPKKYHIANVQAYKHNGRLYRQWNGVVILDITENFICLLLSNTKVMEDSGQKWIIKEPMIWFFPKNDKFYNTNVLFRKTGLYYYTNLASPFVFEDNTFKYIDYDLDVKKQPQHKTLLLDSAEYKRNYELLKYPIHLNALIENAQKEIFQLIEEEKEIFKPSLSTKYFNFIKTNNYIKKSPLK